MVKYTYIVAIDVVVVNCNSKPATIKPCIIAIPFFSHSPGLVSQILEQDLAPDSKVLFRDGDSIDDKLLTTLRGTYSGNHYVLSSGRELHLTKQTMMGGPHKGIKLRYMQGNSAFIVDKTQLFCMWFDKCCLCNIKEPMLYVSSPYCYAGGAQDSKAFNLCHRDQR